MRSTSPGDARPERPGEFTMHLLVMTVFAALVSVVFAAITNEANSTKTRAVYGLKTFGYFVGVGLLLSWVIYFIP